MIVKLFGGKNRARRLARDLQLEACSACRADVARAVLQREMQYARRFA